ncbi:hypothetical protein HBN50_02980 [Halobacteriovorax sp. GB3]|uniref:hypothetical protein n=1 Tax=Halobacteriovorax sp. GB3 TaxID=2719615 RepID=UPI002361D936|nr:hypothetical protein [Halobacteriovorax sp. GB3]MDD0852039.1 hypothetical protein [Halobacteriovorax sp. GB3]
MKFSYLLLFLLMGCATTSSYIGPVEKEPKKKSDLNAEIPAEKTVFYVTQQNRSGSCKLYVNKTYIGQLNNAHVLRVEAPAGKHKLLCYFGGNATTYWFNKYYDSFKEIDFDFEGGKKHFVLYTWKYSKKHKMNRPFLTVDIDPDIVDKKVAERGQLLRSTKFVTTNHFDKEEQKVLAKAKEDDTISGYKNFLFQYPSSKSAPEIKERLSELEKEDDMAFSRASKNNTFKSYIGYIESFSKGKHISSAVASAIDVAKVKKKPIRFSHYRKLISINANYMSQIPASDAREIELLEIGPENFNVAKVIELKKKGHSSSILSAKIKATNERYKNFTMEEIGSLKGMGLDEKIIEAMITVTATYDSRIKAITENKEMMAQIQKLIKSSQKSANKTYSRRTPSNSNNNNTLTSCIKRKAALEACRNVSGFLRSACEMTAKSTYPCR